MLHGELPPEYELAANSALQLLLAFTRPPRPGRILTVVGDGTYTVEMDDPDGGTATAWGLNGFTYAVSDVVYILFAANTPDSGIIVGGKAPIPTLDHGSSLTGKTDDDHTQYALLAGRATGQTLNGGTASGDDLTLDSTAHATKGDLLLQPSGGNVGIGTSTPGQNLDIEQDAGICGLRLISYRTTTAGNARANTNGYAASGSKASPANLGVDQVIYRVAGFAFDNGTTFTTAARIEFAADAVHGSGDVPGRISFWTTPDGSATVAQRMVIKSDGKIGIGTSSPQGILHVHDGTGGELFVTKTAVAGTAVTLIPNGTGDVTAALHASGAVKPSTSAAAGTTLSLIVSDDLAIYDDGAGNTVNLRVNADGSVDVRRTAGTQTYTVALHLTWI